MYRQQINLSRCGKYPHALLRSFVATALPAKLIFDALLLFCSFATTVSAATWNLNNNGNWNVNANWISPATFPNGVDAVAEFGSIITANRSITIPVAVNITVGSIDFNDNNNYVIGGTGTLTFDVTTGNATVTTLAGNTGAHTLPAFTANDSLVVTNTSVNSGMLTLGGTITKGANLLTVAGAGDTTISGSISGGSGGLLKQGSGELVLSVANTYSGSTTISGGVVRLSNANSLPGGIGATGGTSALILYGGVLSLGSGNFARGLGTGSSQVQFQSSGGFAAVGALRTVNLGGASAAATWGTGNFVPSGSNLILSDPTANNTLEFQNPINLNSGTRTFQIENGSALVDARLTGVISNGSLNKTGAGLLELSQTSVNTYTGDTTVSKGVLRVDLGGLATPTNLVNSASALKLGGAHLQVLQKSNTTSSQTFNGATLLAGTGDSLITSTNVGTTNNLTVALAALNRETGATINFALPTRGSITTTNTNIGGILGGYAFVPNGGDVNWAVATGGVISGLTSYTPNTGGVFPSSGNVLMLDTIATTSASNFTVNSIKFDTDGQSGTFATITLNNSGSSVITSGGIIAIESRGNGGVGSAVINGGSITSGNGKDLIVNAYNQLTGREVSVVIGSTIADNGSTSIGLTKIGDGTLVLNGANTFTGDTVIANNPGVNRSNSTSTVLLGNSLGLQNSVLNYNYQGGILSFGTLTAATLGGLRGSEDLALLNGSSAAVALTIGNSNSPANNPVYAGVLSGTGATLTKVGSNTQTLTGNNTFTGNTSVQNGTLIVGVDGIGSLVSAVNVVMGTIGGSGTIVGTLTVGNGVGSSDAFIAPGNSPGTLTTLSSLTMQSDAVYSFELNSGLLLADQIVASGVTINGALFSITDLGPTALPLGTQFVAISNTSGSAIGGAYFSNLPQGGTISAGPNTFQADYFGGDGNDFVLIAVPEPSSFALMALGACWWARRRRWRFIAAATR